MSSERWVIAGLGNPGKQYEATRHNIGFLVVENLVGKLGRGASSWQGNCDRDLAELSIGGARVHVVKPLRYMNESGGPLGELLKFYKVPAENLIVIHDEIDLAAGRLKVKRGGGDAGHNGLRSISKVIGTRDYFRVRVGVGRPPNPRYEVSDWVLGRFSSEEWQEVEPTVEKAARAAAALVEGELEDVQRELCRY